MLVDTMFSRFLKLLYRIQKKGRVGERERKSDI